MTTATDLEMEVAPVQTSANYTWMLTLTEFNGKCCLQWSTNAPFRAQQGKVCLYSGSFPNDPTSNTKAVSWDNENNHNYVTDQDWGSHWCAAWIAQASPNGPYVYLAKTGVTTAE